MMNKYLFFFLLFSLANLYISCNLKGNNKHKNFQETSINTGKVHSVMDGDTYNLLIKENKTVRIRMEGIDAPEKGMPFYRVSKNYLKELCIGQTVRIEINDTDRYGRLIAYTYLNDSIELGQEMIKAGLAWHFKKYNSDTVLAELEIKAREQKIGLWVDESPMPPWRNRELHRNGISTKDSFKILEHQR